LRGSLLFCFVVLGRSDEFTLSRHGIYTVVVQSPPSKLPTGQQLQFYRRYVSNALVYCQHNGIRMSMGNQNICWQSERQNFQQR
ncbi:hypothetical protein BDR26DRAFT_874864, partial [Obelidium mucronatum]